MNEATQTFLDELKRRTDVMGVIMFGSWARGNNRPDSDVDLVIILTEGYRRTVEHRDGQAFEIIYTTEKDALDYWKNHKDDAAGLWEVATVLFDKDGTVQCLQDMIAPLLSAGKKPIDEFELAQKRFDIEDAMKYVEANQTVDPTSASFILAQKVTSLTELFFDIRRMWTPAPKQRLAKIDEIIPEYSSLIDKFYQPNVSMNEKLDVVRKMIALVFGS